MDREILKQVIADQREYQFPQHFVKRRKTEEIQKFIDDPSILIMSGLRRSGKSTILRLVQQKHVESDYYLNFDDDRLVQFEVQHFQMLLEVFIELFGKQTTFFFDEIQNVEGWERFVRRLYDRGDKVFITGSNANLLSAELGTRLTGRYIQFEIYPLAFEEVMEKEYPEVLSKKALSTDDVGMVLHHFSSYFKHGGIPEYYTYRKQEYLKDLYEGILYRDIVARYHITHEKALRELVYYFASHIGKEFNYTKLSKTIGLSSPNTVSNYCNYLEQCYLCFFLSRYSHSLKKQMHHNKKCYMIDTALIRAIGFRTSEDKGRLLENVVFLELKRQGKDVYFHKDKKECDFIVREKNHIVQAIQVTTSLGADKVKEREVEGLVEAMKAYQLNEGLILTENEYASLDVEGLRIEVLPLWKWLLRL